MWELFDEAVKENCRLRSLLLQHITPVSVHPCLPFESSVSENHSADPPNLPLCVCHKSSRRQKRIGYANSSSSFHLSLRRRRWESSGNFHRLPSPRSLGEQLSSCSKTKQPKKLLSPDLLKKQPSPVQPCPVQQEKQLNSSSSVSTGLAMMLHTLVSLWVSGMTTHIPISLWTSGTMTFFLRASP